VAKKQDRRVQRTEGLLRGALLSLIQEKGFEALSVQDIIDRANVGRATFYAHFDNKDDLLASGFDGLRASLRARQREALARGGSLDERVFGFSLDLFVHTGEHREVFRAMVGRPSGAAVEQILRRIIVELIRDDVKAALPRDGGTVPRDGLVQFLAGALFGLLMWWMDGRMRVPPGELNTLFRRLATPALKTGIDQTPERTDP